MKYDVDYIKKLWFANRNFISWRFYMGITNQTKLKEAGFTTPERLTFNQAKKNGLKIKAWSKGIVVQHNEVVEVKEQTKDWGTEVKKIPQVKSRLLFNVEQTEPVKVH